MELDEVEAMSEARRVLKELEENKVPDRFLVREIVLNLPRTVEGNKVRQQLADALIGKILQVRHQ